jgi:tRNA A37 threonylcarbamoyladenosine synthetase subunit TsaC/SUA5/YrdC
VPDLHVTQALLEAIDAPMLSMSLIMPDDENLLNEAWEIRDRLEHAVDLIIDIGSCPAGETSVINLTGEVPELVRAGLGDLAPFGLE